MKRKWISCLIFFGAIISGALYCLYLQSNDKEFFKMIYRGLLSNYEQKISSSIVLKLFLDYVKKICIIFVLGSFSILVPLGFLMMFIVVFSYSFTISCFVALYGLKGAIASFLLYGIQSAVLVISGFYILNYRKNSVFTASETKGGYQTIYMMGAVAIGIGLIVGLDLMGILNFNFIKQIFL